MIFDAIVFFLVSVFRGVLGLLPDVSINFSGAGGSIGNALAGANTVFPVATLGLCIAAVMAVRFFMLGATLLTWIWDKIPFTFK